MSADEIDRYRMMLHDSNVEAKNRRKKIQILEQKIERLTAKLAQKDEEIEKFKGQVGELETALVELDEVRESYEAQLQNLPQELEEYRKQDFLNQHKEAFKEMLGETNLHPQANLEQLWQMVGYDPFEIEELTPDLVNQVLDKAKQELPFLFMGKDVSQTMPPNGYQTGPQQAGVAAAQGFVQPSGFLRSPAVANQPAPPQFQQAPQGWSGVAARGVPIQPQPQAFHGRFGSAQWVAENRKAITEAVENGAQFVSSD